MDWDRLFLAILLLAVLGVGIYFAASVDWDGLSGSTESSDSSLEFAVVADSQREGYILPGWKISKAVEDFMKDESFPNIDFVIHVGDLHAGRETPTENSLLDFMKNPDEKYGWGDLHLPYFVLWGNHDATSYPYKYEGMFKETFFDADFESPFEKEYKGNPDKPYWVPRDMEEMGRNAPFYSYEYDNLLFLMVSTGLGNHNVLNQAQRDWLEQITEIYPDKTTFIMTHRPPYGSTLFSTQAPYKYSMDTYSWWEGFLENNDQILLYTHGHNITGKPYNAEKFGVNVIKNAMHCHGDSAAVTHYKITENHVKIRFYNNLFDIGYNHLMDKKVNSTYNPEGLEWISNPHITQDGETIEWKNKIISENYKVQLIGEGEEDTELVWLNRKFNYYTDMWLGYENDFNNGKPSKESLDPAGYSENGQIKFYGVDNLAAATWYERTGGPDSLGYAHVGGKIPWSTTPWAVPGGEYDIRVKVKADEPVENAMDVSVKVLTENINREVMGRTKVIEDIDLTENYQWYEGSFTVPENDQAWIIKTIWNSKDADATIYMDEWSVRRGDKTGTSTDNFYLTINGTEYGTSETLPEGSFETLNMDSSDINNVVNIESKIGGNRMGMFRMIYEDPIVWSDDVSMGLIEESEDAYDVHLERVSKYSETVSLSPFEDSVVVENTNSVNVKDYYTAWTLGMDELPENVIIRNE